MLPETIHTEDELVEVMTRPSPALIEFIPTLQSPLVILGAGGKMGATLALLAKRAAQMSGIPFDILAVSRCSDQRVLKSLQAGGVRALSADLLDPAVYARLTDTHNLIYMVGLKFGTTQNPHLTWATNMLIPAYTAERYPHARIAALSTGNVYPLAPVNGPGSKESDPLTPLGEYSNACVARERIFEYFSIRNQTPMVLLRLSFALDLRYGVLVDIAQKVYRNEPVDISVPTLNCIWQGDANDMIIRSLSLASTPPLALNLVHSHRFEVADLAQQFGEWMGKEVSFAGVKGNLALLSDNSLLRKSLGEPPTPIERVIRWTADWVKSGGRLLNKPTHFEVRDGGY
jgi:nucleoside-diphosphate-sugar epimerase